MGGTTDDKQFLQTTSCNSQALCCQFARQGAKLKVIESVDLPVTFLGQ